MVSVRVLCLIILIVVVYRCFVSCVFVMCFARNNCCSVVCCCVVDLIFVLMCCYVSLCLYIDLCFNMCFRV